MAAGSSVIGDSPGRAKPPDPLPRVLVFNFFADLKARGIPAYTAGLLQSLAHLGVPAIELKAPRWAVRLPPMLQNLLFVAYEQLVAPWLSRWHGCSLSIYPYNSVGLIDAVAGRAVMVVHDLIPSRRDSDGLAARYIRTCQRGHTWLRRPVAAVSRHTLRQLQRLPRFAPCEKYLWANPFYAFEAALAGHRVPLRRAGGETRVLLCSGSGPNKQFREALRLLTRLPDPKTWRVRVLGFGDEAALAVRRVEALPPVWRDRVEVLPKLDLDEIVREYLGADLVWVHSRAEGFGRPVVEARLCGRPVLASDIGAFRQLRKLHHVHLYREDSFDSAVGLARADAAKPCGHARAAFLHDQLEQEVMRLLTERPDRARRSR
ncbi:MAG: glycosyltransferase [Burkholderiales bacterium]|nr:glycosyltransferase [Burkholderiales bacterium]